VRSWVDRRLEGGPPLERVKTVVKPESVGVWRLSTCQGVKYLDGRSERGVGSVLPCLGLVYMWRF
jgi:hypothetical protein